MPYVLGGLLIYQPVFAEKLESEMLPVAMATILDPFQALQADKDRWQNLEERP